MPIKDIHTSGHADLHGLKRMIEAVKPKHIVPIHTEKAKSYKEYFPGENVLELDDHKTIQV